MCLLEQAVGKRRLAMVNVRNDGKGARLECIKGNLFFRHAHYAARMKEAPRRTVRRWPRQVGAQERDALHPTHARHARSRDVGPMARSTLCLLRTLLDVLGVDRVYEDVRLVARALVPLVPIVADCVRIGYVRA